MSASLDTHWTINAATFAERYRPVPNHLDKTALIEFGCGGCLFAAAGKELRYVLAQGPGTVWTLCEVDGALFIERGLLLGDRLGYLVTEQPREDNRSLTIRLED